MGSTGVGIVSVIMVLLVGVVVYKTCAALPAGGVLPGSLRFAGTDSDLDSVVIGDESPWDTAWRNASDPGIAKETKEQADKAAAAIGGEFAGLLKPGAERVRAPQVITRSAALDLTVALSRISPGPEVRIARESSIVNVIPTSIPTSVPDADLPKVDLMFVFDASGSLQWREYRILKEAFTGPGGLMDEIMARAGTGSRVGFVEYAYDCLVVSELDSDLDRVRRRILGSFQGDTNNWERESMFIYEVDADMGGGNALRKVTSLSAQAARKFEADAEEILWDIEQAPTISAREVPHAMNGMSREAHLALKWAKYELMPPVANEEVMRALMAANRLRRVLVVNAGALTKGGDTSLGVAAAVREVTSMKESGIEVVTLGVGTEQDFDLRELATRRRHGHLTLEQISDVQSLQPELVSLLMHTPRKRRSVGVQEGIALAVRKLFEKQGAGTAAMAAPGDVPGVAKDKRHGGVTKTKKAHLMVRSKSKRIPRGQSELPWFNNSNK